MCFFGIKGILPNEKVRVSNYFPTFFISLAKIIIFSYIKKQPLKKTELFSIYSMQ